MFTCAEVKQRETAWGGEGHIKCLHARHGTHTHAHTHTHALDTIAHTHTHTHTPHTHTQIHTHTYTDTHHTHIHTNTNTHRWQVTQEFPDLAQKLPLAGRKTPPLL